jgi:hypothetical protein
MIKPNGAFRACLVAGAFALCSGAAHASTLDVSFVITNNNDSITAAALDIVSSTDLTGYTGSLTSCTTQCGPPTTGSGELDNGMGTDSTIVLTGGDAGTYDLIFGNYTQASDPTTVVLTDGVVTGISFGNYITSNSNHDQCNPGGPCLQSVSSTEIAVLDGVPGSLGADLSLPPAPPPTPTPLPATVPLFLSGLGVIGFAARRRKNKALA